MQTNEKKIFDLFNFNIEIMGHRLKHVGAIIASCKHNYIFHYHILNFQIYLRTFQINLRILIFIHMIYPHDKLWKWINIYLHSAQIEKFE
jgi:hypothetical protein